MMSPKDLPSSLLLYSATPRSQSAAEISVILRENGLTPDLVGTDYHLTVANGFKGSGYPVINRTEVSGIKDYEETNPIVLSGKFVRTEHGNGIIISPKLRDELLSKYPDISVEEGLRQAGLDPVDVGYQRINRIQKDLEREQKHIYHKQVEEFGDSCTDDFSDESGNVSENNLDANPYIQDIRYDRIVLKDCFYNECYMLYPLGIGRIFNIYELTSESFTERNKIAISSRLYHWNKTEAEVEIVNEQTLRIQRARTQAINSLVNGGFDEISIAIKKMDTSRGIENMPHSYSSFSRTKRL